jgi:hypothetical protein
MSNAGRTPPMQVFALSALQSCEFEDRGTKMNGWLFVAKCVMCLCIAAALKSCVGHDMYPQCHQPSCQSIVSDGNMKSFRFPCGMISKCINCGVPLAFKIPSCPQ